MGFWKTLFSIMFAPDEYDNVPDKFVSRPASMTETHDEMQEQITRIKPRLAMEWRKLINDDPYAAGSWLDENFPIPGGWGHHLVLDGPRLLRDCYPSHGPVDPSHCP